MQSPKGPSALTPPCSAPWPERHAQYAGSEHTACCGHCASRLRGTRAPASYLPLSAGPRLLFRPPWSGREHRLSQQPTLPRKPLPRWLGCPEMRVPAQPPLPREPAHLRSTSHQNRRTLEARGSSPQRPGGETKWCSWWEEANSAHCNTRVVSSNSQIKQTASAAIFTSRSAMGNR